MRASYDLIPRAGTRPALLRTSHPAQHTSHVGHRCDLDRRRRQHAVGMAFVRAGWACLAAAVVAAVLWLT